MVKLIEPENIKDTLFQFLKTHGLYDTLLDFQVVDYYNDVFVSTKPELEDSRALDINAGILKLETENPVQRYEIMVNKKSIINAINKHFSKNIVKDIVVRTGG